MIGSDRSRSERELCETRTTATSLIAISDSPPL
jgi:hypothetical protein